VGKAISEWHDNGTGANPNRNLSGREDLSALRQGAEEDLLFIMALWALGAEDADHLRGPETEAERNKMRMETKTETMTTMVW